MGRSSGLSRLLGFAITPAIAAVGPLLLLPVLTRVAGAEGWTALVTGQSVGAVVGTIAMYSWQTFGPPRVAGAPQTEARHQFYLSLVMRGTLSVIAAPVGIIVLASLVPHEWLLASTVLCMSSVMMAALTNGWFYVGRADPRSYVLIETTPRVSAVVLSAISLLVGLGVDAYAWITLAAEVLIVAIAGMRNARRAVAFGGSVREIGSIAREHARLTFSSIASLGYTRASTPIVAAVDFTAASSFAAADRMQNIARTVLRPITQALQPWVYEGRGDTQEFRRRAFKASIITGGVGFILGAGLAICLPPLGFLLFSDEIDIDWSTSVPLGVAVLMVSVSGALATFYLVPAGRTKAVATSLLTTSLLGVPALVAGAFIIAPVGPLVVIAVVETIVALWQLLAVRSWIRHIAKGEAHATA